MGCQKCGWGWTSGGKYAIMGGEKDSFKGIMANKSNTKRKLVGLVSDESGNRTYYTKKNTMNTPDKLTLRKYDPILRKHVLYTETKKNLGRNEVKEKKN